MENVYYGIGEFDSSLRLSIYTKNDEGSYDHRLYGERNAHETINVPDLMVWLSENTVFFRPFTAIQDYCERHYDTSIEDLIEELFGNPLKTEMVIMETFYHAIVIDGKVIVNPVRYIAPVTNQHFRFNIVDSEGTYLLQKNTFTALGYTKLHTLIIADYFVHRELEEYKDKLKTARIAYMNIDKELKHT